MRYFRKYEFGSKSAASAKINALGIDEEANPDWDAQMVWFAPLGVHTFGSSSAIAEWTQKCKELHPEFFLEPSEEIV
jgi:hypothetical protein